MTYGLIWSPHQRTKFLCYKRNKVSTMARNIFFRDFAKFLDFVSERRMDNLTNKRLFVPISNEIKRLWPFSILSYSIFALYEAPSQRLNIDSLSFGKIWYKFARARRDLVCQTHFHTIRQCKLILCSSRHVHCCSNRHVGGCNDRRPWRLLDRFWSDPLRPYN